MTVAGTVLALAFVVPLGRRTATTARGSNGGMQCYDAITPHGGGSDAGWCAVTGGLVVLGVVGVGVWGEFFSFFLSFFFGPPSPPFYVMF